MCLLHFWMVIYMINYCDVCDDDDDDDDDDGDGDDFRGSNELF